jgi:hypothetical protein
VTGLSVDDTVVAVGTVSFEPHPINRSMITARQSIVWYALFSSFIAATPAYLPGLGLRGVHVVA